MKFTDMAMSPTEAASHAYPTATGDLNKYPYGLCISLCKDELEKLDIDFEDAEVGDFFHLHSLARITSKSNNETEAGESPRLELVLAFLEVESEEEEDDEADKSLTGKLYK